MSGGNEGTLRAAYQGEKLANDMLKSECEDLRTKLRATEKLLRAREDECKELRVNHQKEIATLKAALTTAAFSSMPRSSEQLADARLEIQKLTLELKQLKKGDIAIAVMANTILRDQLAQAEAENKRLTESLACEIRAHTAEIDAHNQTKNEREDFAIVRQNRKLADELGMANHQLSAARNRNSQLEDARDELIRDLNEVRADAKDARVVFRRLLPTTLDTIHSLDELAKQVENNYHELNTKLGRSVAHATDEESQKWTQNTKVTQALDEIVALRRVLLKIHVQRAADDDDVCSCGECSQCLSRYALEQPSISESLVRSAKSAIKAMKRSLDEAHLPYSVQPADMWGAYTALCLSLGEES